MTQANALLRKTRVDLLDILGDPTHTTAFALLGAVRRYLRTAGPAGEPLSDELLACLSVPHTTDALEAALPHRRRADISRTLNWLSDQSRITKTHVAGRGWLWSKTT